LKDAIFLLEQQGLNVLVNGKGMVIRQSIPAGTWVTRGTPVVIDLQVKKQEKPKAQA
jgi:cell division protein FtsI (penicillin-binding protein 3)